MRWSSSAVLGRDESETTEFTYNEAGWNTGEEWLNAQSQVIYQSTLEYDNAGDLTLAQDNNSLYNYTYNSGGQLIGETVTYPGYSSSPLVTLGFTYDAFGNRIGMTDSLGGNMGYSYNGENQMTGMSLALNGTTAASLAMNYDGLARLSGTTMSSPSGATIASTNTYDNASRLTNISYTNMGSTLASYNYAYNAAGEITNYQDNSGNALTYGYDYSGELTSASGTLAGSNYNQSWSYDANGNRNMTGYNTGTGNQLLSDGVNNYTYDKNGNTLTQTNIATGTVTNYSWDYANRLTEVKVVNSSGTVLNDETFTYDIFGNRIGVSLNGTQALYTVYDGSNPYMDFNGSGTLTERYLYNPYGLNQFYGQVNGSGTTEWFVTDNLNSIRQVLSASGTSLATIVYDPFGQLLTSLNSYAPRFLYTGGAYDPITGMYTNGAREENPADGRWLSQDPLGFMGGDYNLYRYSYNIPNDYRDPRGLASTEVDVWYDYPNASRPGKGQILFNHRAWIWLYEELDKDGKSVATFKYNYMNGNWYMWQRGKGDVLLNKLVNPPPIPPLPDVAIDPPVKVNTQAPVGPGKRIHVEKIKALPPFNPFGPPTFIPGLGVVGSGVDITSPQPPTGHPVFFGTLFAPSFTTSHPGYPIPGSILHPYQLHLLAAYPIHSHNPTTAVNYLQSFYNWSTYNNGIAPFQPLLPSLPSGR